MRKNVLLCVLLLATAVMPALADTLYENGPINGTTDGWTINFGFVVSDTFNISTGSSTITGLSFGVWITPGDVVQSVEIFLSDQEFGGTVYFDQQVNVMQSNCSVNSYGYDICTETALFNGPTLDNGRYWLTLLNAESADGDPVYWDENSGVGCHSPGCPSDAGPGGEGTLPSEAFTIEGTSGGTGTTPEPESLVLFASGFVACVGGWRRYKGSR